MRQLLLGLCSLLLIGCDVLGPEACEYEESRSAELSATDLNELRVTADAGSLEIVGRADLESIRVQGDACASSTGLLSQIELTAERTGQVGEITVTVPAGTAELDLVIEAPMGLALRVQDGSGDAVIRDVASLDMTDGSGDLRIEALAGDVAIDDGSGQLVIEHVGGSVWVTDGSGDIRVADIGGNFVVAADGSGEIEYDRVDGTVDLPR